MPQYEYQGEHGNGAPASGVIEAIDVNEAISRLSGHGMKLRAIRPSTGESSLPVHPSLAVQSQAAASHAPAPQLQDRKRTSPTSYWDIHFFFFQLSDMLKAGISPAEALKALSKRTRNRALRDASLELARATAAGAPLSDAMEAYPDLFSPGVSGAIRAGEQGGYLVDAAAEVGRQNGEAARTNRFFWFYPVALSGTFLGLLIGLILAAIAKRGPDAINGQIGVNEIVSKGFGDFLATPWPWVLGGIALASIWWAWAKRRRFTRRFRHWLALTYPVVGRRSRQENLGIFAWHMMKLSEAGLSPWKSWTLAASATPNAVYSQRLLADAGPMSEAMGFSAIAASTKLVPPEYMSLVQTGEMTGQLPQAFEHLMKQGADEAKTAGNVFKLMMTISGVTLVLTAGLLGFVIFYGNYLLSAFRVLE